MIVTSLKKLCRPFIPKYVLHRIGYEKAKLRRSKLMAEFSGDDVQCPICGATQSEFAPFKESRPNAWCLTCGSLERHRLLWLYLQRETDFWDEHKPLRLLHFAPPVFTYSAFSEADHIDYYPVDLFPEKYNHRGSTRILKADITDLPFEDDFFDVVLCYHVLEHVVDDRKAMEELFRVMRKETGWGIFQVPIDYDRETTYEDFSITDPDEREIAFGQFDHVRWYGRDYIERLESVGFDVTEDAFVQDLPEVDRRYYGLDEVELLNVCRKRV